MSEEKDFELENHENETEVTKEETAAAQEEQTDMTDAPAEEIPAAEDVREEASAVPEESAAAEQDFTAPLETEEAPKKKGKGKMIAVASVIVVLVAAIAVYFIVFFNPYNHLGYTNVTGRTIGEIAEESGMTLEEFLAQYELPANMKANTTEAAAFYSIPTKIMAQMYGMDFETLKTSLQLGDDVTEDTPWGEAEGSIKLSVYVGGEEELNEFKQEYGLGDEITGDTQWKDVRKVVEKKSLEAAQATDAPAEETDAPAETAAADAAETQAPAEGQPAA